MKLSYLSPNEPILLLQNLLSMPAKISDPLFAKIILAYLFSWPFLQGEINILILF